ncbi:MAG: NrtA/SsuA/CpmA family ABC transporter substrate-binding protein [Coriobacteriia bacterium]
MRQTRTTPPLRAVTALVCCTLLAGLVACDRGVTVPDDTRSITLGVSGEALDSLAYIARDEGLFEQEGLEVGFVEFDSTQAALEAMLAGEVDAALCADTPIVTAAIEGKPFRVITTIGTHANDIKIVARASEGITEPSDLRGKRVGTRRGTAAHFFLHVFLVKYALADTDVQLSYDTFENVTAALISGQLDAVAVRQPFVSQLKQALGDDFVLFEEEGLYEKTMNLCVPDGEGEPDTETKERLVRAFIAAEEVGLDDSTGQIHSDVAEAMGVPEEDLCDCIIVPGSVGLRQSLVLGFEDQARWAIGSGFVSAPEVLDMLSVIDTTVLDTLAPERVTVIR